MSDIENRIAETLGAHGEIYWNHVAGGTFCECDMRLSSKFDHRPDKLRTHQAAMLAPLIAEAQAVAWDDGGEALLNYIENQHTGIDPDRNPYDLGQP